MPSRGNLGYLKTRRPAPTKVWAGPAPREAPSALQVRLLQALAAEEPLSSGRIGTKLGLFSGELRAACVWLQKAGFIQHEIRRVKVSSAIQRLHFQRTAFWSLTKKGRDFVQGAPAALTVSDTPS